MADPLDAFSSSPEAQITQAFFAVLKADTTISTAFSPILLIESPTREAFNALTERTMALVPLRLRIKDFPSSRQLVYLDLVVSAYLAKEPTEEDSKLRGLNLGSHLRKLAYSNLGVSGLAFEAVDFTYLPALEPRATGIRILSFQITFQTDIEPATGQFL